MANTVFEVDYSTDDRGNFKVYEIQRYSSSNNHALSNDSEVEKSKFKTNFSKHYSNLLDMPRYLNANKYLQRILLAQNDYTKEYNPDFLVVNRKEGQETLTEDDKAKLELFYTQHDSTVVVKEFGALGRGNKFFKKNDINDFLNYVEFMVEHNDEEPFVIEGSVMYSPDQYKKMNNNEVDIGVYRRDIVISKELDEESREIFHYEVYKNLLNRNKTTDNHDHRNDYNLVEKGYLGIDMEEPIYRMQGKTNKHPTRYQQRNYFFKNLDKAIRSGIKAVEPGELSSCFLSEIDQNHTNEDIKDIHNKIKLDRLLCAKNKEVNSPTSLEEDTKIPKLFTEDNESKIELENQQAINIEKTAKRENGLVTTYKGKKVSINTENNTIHEIPDRTEFLISNVKDIFTEKKANLVKKLSSKGEELTFQKLAFIALTHEKSNFSISPPKSAKRLLKEYINKGTKNKFRAEVLGEGVKDRHVTINELRKYARKGFAENNPKQNDKCFFSESGRNYEDMQTFIERSFSGKMEPREFFLQAKSELENDHDYYRHVEMPL